MEHVFRSDVRTHSYIHAHTCLYTFTWIRTDGVRTYRRQDPVGWLCFCTLPPPGANGTATAERCEVIRRGYTFSAPPTSVLPYHCFRLHSLPFTYHHPRSIIIAYLRPSAFPYLPPPHAFPTAPFLPYPYTRRRCHRRRRVEFVADRCLVTDLMWAAAYPSLSSAAAAAAAFPRYALAGREGALILLLSASAPPPARAQCT